MTYSCGIEVREIKAKDVDSDYGYIEVLEGNTIENEKIKNMVCDEYKIG